MASWQLSPELLVEDVDKSLKFYCDVLGFKPEIVFPEDQSIFAQVTRNNIHLMLDQRDDFAQGVPQAKQSPMGGTVLIYIRVDQVVDLYHQIKDKVTVIQPLHTMDYGATEFIIEDCNGYFLAFSQKTSP